MSGVIKPQSISHWYSKDGLPMYDIEKVKGGKRKTTIRDARKYGWFPSVTSILKIVDKPFLNAWIANQAIEACMKVSQNKLDHLLDNGHDPLPLTDSDLPEIRRLSDEVSKTAREKGQRVHREIERIVRSLAEGKIMRPEDSSLDRLTFLAFLDVYRNHTLRARLVEHSFANKRYGFGGRLDWAGTGHIRPTDNRIRTTYLDYKTQNTKGKGEFTVYAETPCQLAAYAYGTGRSYADLGTVFIDTSIEGNVQLIYHPDNDDYFYAFLEAFRVWKGPLGKKYQV